MEDNDVLKNWTFIDELGTVDFIRLLELKSEQGSSQLSYFVKNWEWKQENAVRLLREEFENLRKQQHEVELKKLEIMEERRFQDQSYVSDTDAKTDTVKYWKQRALHSEILLEESVQREKILLEKLEESIENLEKISAPAEDLSKILKRADNFLHFVLQNSPVLIGHQDEELRYRFFYNHYSTLKEEGIIGKTDVEIFKGGGVKECQDFKREVLERGVAANREITFETELFGAKTFLMHVEPVLSKAGEKIGVNYIGMEITDQVKKREKMAKIREEIAVQKAREIEINKTIHLTGLVAFFSCALFETMRAKEMLETMSDVIRSPFVEIISKAKVLLTSKLDKDQNELLNVMLSLADIALQRINDILDLSKVESREV